MLDPEGGNEGDARIQKRIPQESEAKRVSVARLPLQMPVAESRYWSASQLLAQKPVVAKTLPVGHVAQEVDAVHVAQVSLQAVGRVTMRRGEERRYG